MVPSGGGVTSPAAMVRASDILAYAGVPESDHPQEDVGKVISTLGDRGREAEYLLKKLDDEAAARHVVAHFNQTKINDTVKHLEAKHVEGIGEWCMRIDRDVALFEMSQNGATCFNDPDFVDHFLNRYPAMRIKLHTRNYVNGWSPE